MVLRSIIQTANKGIIRVSDLINEEGNIMDFDEASSNKDLKPIHFIQYNSILASLGNDIRHLLMTRPPRFAFSPSINNRLMGMSMKSIYKNKIDSLVEEPTSEEFFENLLQLELVQWEDVYKLPFLVTIENKMRAFQFKINHNLQLYK